MQAEIDHIREVEAVSKDGGGARDRIVVESWLRCVDKHGLDPSMRSEAYILPESALRLHRQRSEDLVAIARSGIDDLYKLVAGQSYVLMLSDADGVTVEYLGEERQKEELRRSGLYLGAEWSEARAGTCALGACIETGEPLIIHQTDHFDVTHVGLSCTAAPIFDTVGRLTAVLDISLLSSPVPRASQHLALNLVRQTARRIEMANIMAESRGDWVLRLGGSPDFLDVDPEAALRLDGGGHVIGMTNGAARLMGRTLSLDWHAGAALIGRHVSDIFDLGPGTLEGLTRQRAARDRLIQTKDGFRLFAHAIEPRRTTPRRSHSPIHPALRDLAGDDPAMRRVLEQAAALAGGTVPLLLEGASGTGKSVLAAAIHSVARHGAPVFIPCDSIADEEAEVIFGRAGSKGHVPGLIDEAEGGTLILENVEELPPRLQARLLPLVAEGAFRPIGGLRERRTAARVIATTSGTGAGLRPDLLHRLAGARLVLPHLASRHDILFMSQRIFSRILGVPVSFDAEAMAALARHSWAGNLHELAALARSVAASFPATAEVTLGAAHLRLPEATDKGGPILLHHLLTEHGWNVSAVARRLKVDRSTVHRQMKRHGLSRGHSTAGSRI